jgi:hypothetical protein
MGARDCTMGARDCSAIRCKGFSFVVGPRMEHVVILMMSVYLMNLRDSVIWMTSRGLVVYVHMTTLSEREILVFSTSPRGKGRFSLIQTIDPHELNTLIFLSLSEEKLKNRF